MKEKWLRECCIRQRVVCILLYGIAGSAVTVNGGNLSLQRGPVKAEMRADRLLDKGSEKGPAKSCSTNGGQYRRTTQGYLQGDMGFKREHQTRTTANSLKREGQYAVRLTRQHF